MLGSFVKEAMSEVEIENGTLNFAAKTVLPEAVDALEVFAVSTATFFGWTAAVNHAADKKIAAEKKAAEAKKDEKSTTEKKDEQPEVVNPDGQPAT